MTKQIPFHIICKGRLGGIWSDNSWVFNEEGFNIKGGTTNGGYPFFPDEYQQLKKDIISMRQHLEQQLAALDAAEKILPHIRVFPDDIAASLERREPLSVDQQRRLRKLEARKPTKRGKVATELK